MDNQNIKNPKVQVLNLAILSLVLGILSTPPFPFSIFTGIPAILIGNKAINIIKTNSHRGKGLAVSGVIMGYFSIFVTVFLIILIFTGNLEP